VEREKQVLMNEAHVAAARDVARKSIVLLKNEGVLPLQKKAGSIAVIGPFAADRDTPIGSWRAQGEANSAVSLLDGIQAAVGPDVEILYAEGAKLAIGQRDFPFELKLNESDRSGFDAAVEAARKADTVILAIGEDAFQSGEARSQVDVGLKGVQEDLLRAVREANENLVVVLMNGRPLTLMSVDESAAAVVEAWQLGSQSGNAIADVLFGDYNPSGKLPVSFPRHVGQEPLYYNHKNTGRPAPDAPGMVFWSHYTDAPNSPLYPFGYGLSYTTFGYSELSLSSAEMTMDGSVTVSLELSNTGDRAGTEVAQLYVRDLVGSATRPVRELKGFQRVSLEAGETRTVTFELTAKDLAYYTPRGAWEAEPGEFEVFVGGSSEAERSARFMLK
jgi:beta-glucosidase